jgi:hypothetical protein
MPLGPVKLTVSRLHYSNSPCKLHMPLEPVDITPETESRYETALDECLETIGRGKQVDILERTVLLLPPAREALKVPIEDASPRSALDLKVWLNRHESRTESVRVLLKLRLESLPKI